MNRRVAGGLLKLVGESRAVVSAAAVVNGIDAAVRVVRDDAWTSVEMQQDVTADVIGSVRRSRPIVDQVYASAIFIVRDRVVADIAAEI